MIDAVLAKHHNLLPIFHKSLRILVHAVNKNLVIEVLLHLCDINNATVCQFLEFGIIDVGAVHCRYLVTLVMARGEPERVVCSRRCELHVAGDSLVGVYHRVNLDTAFLIPRLGMSSHALENGV